MLSINEQEILVVLQEVEQKLYVLAYPRGDRLTEEEKQNIRKAWVLVYGTLKDRL